MGRTGTLLLVFALTLPPSQAAAAEFSLFGGKMGMPRAELDKVWNRQDSGEYLIPGSNVFNVKTEFDHRDRLYILSFSVPIGDQYPSGLMATAFQQLVQEMWGNDPNVSLGTRASRGVVDVTVSSKRLQEDYIEHIKAQLSILLRP